MGVSDGTRWFPATADQVYASVVEQTPAWEDLLVGRHGAATELSFSPYPVHAALVLHSQDARPAIRVEGRTQLDQSLPLSLEAVRHGHIVHQGTWYPVSRADADSIAAVLSELGLDPEALVPTTLRQCLALRQAVANGEPVIDQLCDEVLLNLSSVGQDDRPEGNSRIALSLPAPGLAVASIHHLRKSRRAAGRRNGARQDPADHQRPAGPRHEREHDRFARGRARFPPRKLGSGDRKVLPKPTFHQASRPRAYG